MFPYIYSQQSLTVFANGETLTMSCQNNLFDQAVEALKDGDESRLLDLLKPAQMIFAATAEFSELVIESSTGKVFYDGKQIGGYAVSKLLEFVVSGIPVEPIVNFIRRVLKNPSYRAVNDLYAFLEYGQLPLTPEGKFLAYKRINGDWTDVYTSKISNHVGAVVEMPRQQVDDDPTRTCSSGLHVCSMEYLAHFSGSRIVAVAVDPADVVAIPTDYNNTKMRVAKYTVVAEIPMPEHFNHWERPLVEDYEQEDEPEDEYEPEEEESEYAAFMV